MQMGRQRRGVGRRSCPKEYDDENDDDDDDNDNGDNTSVVDGHYRLCIAQLWELEYAVLAIMSSLAVMCFVLLVFMLKGTLACTMTSFL